MVKPNASAYNHIESDKKGKVLFTDTSNFLFFPLFWKLQFTFAGAESENYSFNGWSESAKSIVRQFRVLPFYLSALNQTMMKLCSTHWATVAFKTQWEYRIIRWDVRRDLSDHSENNTESKYKSKTPIQVSTILENQNRNRVWDKSGDKRLDILSPRRKTR